MTSYDRASHILLVARQPGWFLVGAEVALLTRQVIGKVDSEHSNTDPKREIEVSLSRALTRPDGTEIPVLAEMVSRSLTNIEASNKLSTLHRIGDHELHHPDCRLVCAWAEELNQDNAGTLDSLCDWGPESERDRAT